MNSAGVLFIGHWGAGVAPVPGNKSSDERADILERSQVRSLTQPSQRDRAVDVGTEINDTACHDSNDLLLRPGGIT